MFKSYNFSGAISLGIFEVIWFLYLLDEDELFIKRPSELIYKLGALEVVVLQTAV